MIKLLKKIFERKFLIFPLFFRQNNQTMVVLLSVLNVLLSYSNFNKVRATTSAFITSAFAVPFSCH